MINILFFVLFLVTSAAGHRVDDMQSTLKENLGMERQLKLINKPPVRSIRTRFGYIIDCVDINKQPAFDHHLLKNHKLQRNPSFQKLGKSSVKNSPTRSILGFEKNQCPIGTVPIRRTTKDDLIRAKSFLINHTLTQGNLDTHGAVVTLITIPHSPYYGVSGTTSVYNPRVKKDQSSASIMWVQNGPRDALNGVVVGWHVAPALYNDYATHFFALWTLDNLKKTGCYNLQCPGFVQTDNKYYLGERLDTSGVMLELDLSILQDPVTKNWWLIMQNQSIGYYPATLFSNMTTANKVGWGGRTTTSHGTLNPPMGSGFLPDDKPGQAACYFKNVAYQNESRNDYGPDKYLTQTFNDKPDCFGVKYYGDQGGQVGYFLQFGGPGGIYGN